jgi:hypothetical protein
MVAKGFLAAAAIIICCGTTLRGNDPDGKCVSGDCPTACNDKEPCSDKEQCSVETKCSAEETCDDKEECCEKEQVAVEKCATEKCSTSECAKLKCVAEVAAADEDCCEKKKCSTTACSKEACATTKCALESTCDAGQCNDDSCPVAACASQVCDALKCAIESCTTDECESEQCVADACNAETCDTWFCFDQDCPAGERAAQCSDEVCRDLECAVEASISLSGVELAFTATKTSPEKRSEEKCATEVCTEATCSARNCETAACSSGKCAKSACTSQTGAVVEYPVLERAKATCSASTGCAAAKLADGGSKLETKLAELKRLQEEIAVLRSAVPNQEMYVVDVKVIEVNKSRCRNLGFDFEVAGGNAACEFVGQTLEALMKKNLAHVLFNPTLCVTSDRPASFRAGAEIAPNIAEGKGSSGFVGKTVDVLAAPAGENKVRLHIAPAISELSFAMQDLPQIKTIKWDFACEATLGKPIVLKGADEQRVITKTVDGREPIEVIEQIETMLIVTVNSLENNDLQAEIKQSAYEAALVAEVKKPELITVAYPVPDLQVWKVRPQGVEFDAELLVAHIKSTIDSQSWRGGVYSDPTVGERANGAIQPFERNGSLVICQTEENHEQIAKLLQKMRADGQLKDAAREGEELRNKDGKLEVKVEKIPGGGILRTLVVKPASAEEPAEYEVKCDNGACIDLKCSGSKCNESKCSKSEVSLESESADECPGDCQGECDGDCPETASCPCIGGTCTR